MNSQKKSRERENRETFKYNSNMLPHNLQKWEWDRITPLFLFVEWVITPIPTSVTPDPTCALYAEGLGFEPQKNHIFGPFLRAAGCSTWLLSQLFPQCGINILMIVISTMGGTRYIVWEALYLTIPTTQSTNSKASSQQQERAFGIGLGSIMGKRIDLLPTVKKTLEDWWLSVVWLLKNRRW